ncbi:aminotransferase class III-fold pyridoxal phosphate-dependent enzyme [Ornithinibacillus sp. L9]|uniref:glutamate-1-semialdehyde 2,1-aminomutase n=1 Tax=Ornithinibacillus caprae TaxID=2678566 RepID=A0A6N8FIU2_9BACI|nr:aspartate aminotransferase family protein [Ornithinibacillus caprae]MUK89385.1 aminotransferase class III-fold pyridoxal phosphate-dependent enzyme [Ornithinibacillus caprae]
MRIDTSFESGVKVQSEAMFQRAKQVIPGGISANIKYFPPHPIVMKQANGSHLIDVDDQRYIDYLLCYGALITGHGHDRIVKATTEHMQQIGTTIFGTPHELEVKMAEKLINLYPGIDMVRFTNSGLEATLLAIRMAIAYTGKEKIGKFEGHYHGGFNQVLLSVNPSEKEAGNPRQPHAIPESKGIPTHELKQTIILPFNDLEATENILRENAHQLAAIIIEPIQGGFIPAEPEFINGLRKLTEDLDILLIFDEVKTGFRVHLGGAQSVYQIKPDLTALGKVLGGGFPVGAVGGKKDIMMISAPTQESDIFSVGGESRRKNDVVFHSGTYNGHPIVLAAGLETIRLLEEDHTMEKLFNKTSRLRSSLEKLYRQYDIPMKTIGMGSIFNIILTNQPIRNYRDMWKANSSLRQTIDLELLNLGIYVKPLNRYSLSIVHTEEDINQTVEAHEQAIVKAIM